jgi:glycosyltransferase involved in cell wall biosynthesis
MDGAAIPVREQLGVVMLMRKFYPLTGGYQNQALRLAREMKKAGLRVHVLTQRHGTLAPYEVHQEIPIHRVFAFPSGRLAAWSYLLCAFAWMVRNRARFDIVHANRSSSGLVAGLIGFALGKRVLYKLTRGDEVDAKGLGSGLLGRAKIWALQRTVGKFVSLTDETEQDLLGLGVSPGRIARIPNGIDTENRTKDYDRAAVLAQLSWEPDAHVVTFVGRLVHAKGIDWLLDVWTLVRERDPRARLLIVGDGPERPALTARAHALGIAGSVTFTGRQEDVYQFLAASDVFVLPSRMEGMSNALLEAMSQGVPVVVADDQLGGNRAVVTPGKDGMVVPFGDTEGFARTVQSLLTDRELREEMGRRAAQKVEDAYSIEAVARRYMGLYDELLGAARG